MPKNQKRSPLMTQMRKNVAKYLHVAPTALDANDWEDLDVIEFHAVLFGRLKA